MTTITTDLVLRVGVCKGGSPWAPCRALSRPSAVCRPGPGVHPGTHRSGDNPDRAPFRLAGSPCAGRSGPRSGPGPVVEHGPQGRVLAAKLPQEHSDVAPGGERDCGAEAARVFEPDGVLGTGVGVGEPRLVPVPVHGGVSGARERDGAGGAHITTPGANPVVAIAGQP